jgi:hypothetical protein
MPACLLAGNRPAWPGGMQHDRAARSGRDRRLQPWLRTRRPMSAGIEEGDHGEGPAVVVAGRVVARGGT